MKFKNIALSALSLSMLALTSCSEGKYWDGPKSYGEAYAFSKPSLTVEIPADDEMPSVYNVTVSRADASTEATVDVTFETKTDCLSGPATVTFEKGKLTAEYPISIDASLIEPGFDYAATIKLAEPEGGILSVNKDNQSLNFKIRHELILIWEDAGHAQLTSSFLETETPVDVPIQKATNYPDAKKTLYRLVSPYSYLTGNEVEDGNNIEFICYKGALYKADTLPDGWQATGLTDVDENGVPIYLFLGMAPDTGSSFKNQKTRYIINVAIGFCDYDDPEDDEVTVSDVMEQLSFTWVH